METVRRMSEALKGKPKTAEHRRKLSEANKGHKATEETRHKISKATRGERNSFYGKRHTVETRRKMSEAARNRLPISQETRRKLSKAKSGENSPMWGRKGKDNPNYGRKHTAEYRRKILGKGNPMWGRKHTEETKRKLSEAHRVENLSEETRRRMSEGARNKPSISEETKRRMAEAQKGENNSRWRGGISFEPYGLKFDDALKLMIRERDGFACQLCGVLENGRAHVCHHIDYVKMNNTQDNFVALCMACHARTGVNRAFWTRLFSARFKLGLVTEVIRMVNSCS